MIENHPQASLYEEAMERLERHIHTAPDGTLHLDIADGRDAGIQDPVIFADLKRSLDETNRLITDHKLRVGDIIGPELNPSR